MDLSMINLEELASSVTAWLPRIAGALIIFLVFYIISKLLCRLLLKAMQHMQSDEHLIILFVRTTRIILIIIAIVTAMGTMGVDVSALVAGLGLTGFALGFALKDTISNLLSGVLILLHKPFAVGDTVSIAGFTGKVVTIDLRYTELVSEGNKVLIPNAKLFTDPVTVHFESTE